MEGVDAEGHGEDVAGEGEGVGGDPVDEAAERFGQRGGVEHGGQLAQAVVADAVVGGGAVPDDADFLAPVEGDQDDVAGAGVEAARHGVVEGAAEGPGQQHGDALPARAWLR